MNFIATVEFTKSRCLKIKLNIKYFTLFFLYAFCVPSPAGLELHSISKLVDMMEESLVENKNLPNVSQLNDSLSVKDAYNIQREFAARQSTGKTMGYKAAFFDPSSRKKFKFTEPMSGILKSGCVFSNEQVIRIEDFPGLRLELELGYRLKQEIKLSSKNMIEINNKWFELVPVIEMPQIRFGSIEGINAVDLIAGNVAASCWLEASPISTFDFSKLDQMEVKMFSNRKMIEKVYGNGVGGQEDALAWLIEHLLLRNVRLKKGDLLITGKLGKIHVPVVGRYAVEYGSLSKLTFSIIK